jgi:uncharacterized integral membrane protein (TIGR00697 family)
VTQLPASARGPYPVLVAAFCSLLLIANVAAVKLFDVAGVTVDGGALLFPFTYIIGDVLAEVYGYRAARKAIWIGFALGVLAAACFAAVQALPAANNWPHQDAYEAVLGFVPRVVAASLAAYVMGQLVNAAALVAVKKRTGQRALWLRLLASTAVGEAVDTLVFAVIAFYGVIEGKQFWVYAAVGYAYKCLIEAAMLPVSYRAVAWVRRREGAGGAVAP